MVPLQDVWWIVRGKRVVQDGTKPRIVKWPLSDEDLLPSTLREIAIPMLSDVIDARTAVAARTGWLASGGEPSIHHVRSYGESQV